MNNLRPDQQERTDQPRTPHTPPRLGHIATGATSEYQTTAEQKTLLSGAAALATIITEQYPQVDEKGQINYAFAGSMSVMLLSQADRLEIFDQAALPSLTHPANREIPAHSKTILQNFARRMGDIDFLRSKPYSKGINQLGALGRRVGYDSPDYIAERTKYFGIDYIDTSKASDEVRNAYEHEPRHATKTDPSELSYNQGIARVYIGENTFYILDPLDIIGYKADNVLESLDHIDKDKKYAGDLGILIAGLEGMYGRTALVEAAHFVITRTTSRCIPYANPAFTGTVRDFIEEAMAIDPNSIYLDGLEYGKERSPGILKILSQYEEPGSKKQIIEFINNHRSAIDLREVRQNFQPNILAAAQFVSADQEREKSFRSLFEIDPGTSLEHWLTNDPSRISGMSEALKEMPIEAEQELYHISVGSRILDTLPWLDEGNLGPELGLIDRLLELEMPDYEIQKLFGAELFKDQQARRAIIQGISEGSTRLDEDLLVQFAGDVGGAANAITLNLYSRDELTQEERARLVAQVFNDYEIPLTLPSQ